MKSLEYNEKLERNKRSENSIITDYANYLTTAKGYSNHTIESYKHDLVWLFRFMKLRDNCYDLSSLRCTRKNGKKYTDYTLIDISDIQLKDLEKLTYPDLNAFIAFTANELNNSVNSRKRKVTALKGFFHYLTIKRRLLTYDPTQELEAPKTGQPQPNFLTLEQAQDLIDCISGLHEARDRAIILMFLNTGMRVSELVNLKLSDIQYEMIHVTGKGNKDRTLYLSDSVLEALAIYLPIREQIIEKKNLGDIDYLFLSQKGSQFSTRGIEHMVRKYIIKLGLDPNKYTVHTLRHTAATFMHSYGAEDIRVLQVVLGHESTQTTEIYTHLDGDEVRRALNSNPLAQYKVKGNIDFKKIFQPRSS